MAHFALYPFIFCTSAERNLIISYFFVVVVVTVVVSVIVMVAHVVIAIIDVVVVVVVVMSIRLIMISDTFLRIVCDCHMQTKLSISSF